MASRRKKVKRRREEVVIRSGLVPFHGTEEQLEQVEHTL